MKNDDSRSVTALFNHLLGRNPEQSAIDFYRDFDNIDKVIDSILSSLEYKIKNKQGFLWSYTAIFDAVELVMSKENFSRREVAGHLVNYLGVAVNIERFFPDIGVPGEGMEGPPIPANWHADMAEFAAVFRAVDFAGPSFRMAELGCGWGCWMNISGMAARLSGKEAHLIGIEGDAGHIDFAKESLSTNGFSPHHFTLIHGIAAPTSGTALFPRQNIPGTSWGLEPVFGASDEEIAQASQHGSHDPIRMISLTELLSDQKLDLLHIDIQGGEAILIESMIDAINANVAYIVVGTHSRSIDGKIMDILSNNGDWTLEIERPCLISLSEDGPTTTIDGIQGWRNNKLIRIRTN